MDDGEDAGDQLDRLEKSILLWKPGTGDEALAVLEVLEANLTVGQRSDGADQRAVRNLIQFIRKSTGMQGRRLSLSAA